MDLRFDLLNELTLHYMRVKSINRKAGLGKAQWQLTVK